MPLLYELVHADGSRQPLSWQDPLLRRVLDDAGAGQGTLTPLAILEAWVYARLADGALEPVAADRPALRQGLVDWLERAGSGELVEVRVQEIVQAAQRPVRGETRWAQLSDAWARGEAIWAVYDHPLAALERVRRQAEEDGYEVHTWDLHLGWQPPLAENAASLDAAPPDPTTAGLAEALRMDAQQPACLVFLDLPTDRGYLELQPWGPMVNELVRRLIERPDVRLTVLRPEDEIPARWRGLFRLIRLNTAQSGTPVLDALADDLTERARAGRIEAVLGRETELEALLDVLNRAEGLPNSPLLVGKAGVGKTAIVEALALRVVRDEVPRRFRGRRVMSLSVTALGANASQIGGMESQLRALTHELETHAHDLIVFVDEIHYLMRIGGEGAPAAQALKTSLGRGDIAIVGATTDAESAQLERDPAFARRFKRIVVEEPSRSQTREIALRWRAKLERYHGLRIPDTIVDFAVEEADWHILDTSRPYSAISLLGDAASRSERREHGEVTQDDVYEALRLTVGMDVRLPDGAERERLDGLEASLRDRILGQRQAIADVMSLVRARRLSSRRIQSPFAALLVGPSGTGKTELARRIGQQLFPGVEPVVYDMASYGLEHQATELVGAPPSFVGFEQGSRLVNDIRTRPRTVLIVDEVEKAHPNVVRALMGILDRGEYRDPRGIRGDFRHAFFFFTTNVVTDPDLLDLPDADFHRVVTEGFAARRFGPEQVARFGPAVRFRPLAEDTLERIAALQLGELAQEVERAYGVSLSWSEAVPKALAQAASTVQLGARPLRDRVQTLLGRVGASLAGAGVAEGSGGAVTIDVDQAGGELRIRTE